MLTFFVVILTIALLFDSLLLGLLILVQLPKKDAGVGMAFGGGAADALFGAGSGTALTKLTKYTAAIFFALVVLLSIAESHVHHSAFSALSRQTEQLKKDAAKMPAAQSTEPSADQGAKAAAVSNVLSALQNATNSSAAATNLTTTNPLPSPVK